MAYDDYQALRFIVDRRVAWVTIDHAPINLMDERLIGEIERACEELAMDDGVGAVVFRSADPDFFIAHVDVNRIQLESTDAPARGVRLGRFHRMAEAVRTLPKATIGMIEGRARGGGSELLLSMDMRFGALETARMCQPEVAFGIIPGGGGSVRLAHVVGRSRALEIALGCQDFPAALAERYGLINRALPASELEPFVRTLAERIASFSSEAVALTKAAIDAAGEMPIEEALIEEEYLFNQSLATEGAQQRLARFLTIGGQTRAVELELPELYSRMAPEAGTASVVTLP